MNTAGGTFSSSHGMSGGAGGGAGGGAAKAALQAAPQTREQKLLAQIKGNPGAILKMSDQDAADTVTAIAKQSIRTDGTQNNTFIQRYLNATGLSDNKPQLLADGAYEKARMKAKEASLYHADRDYGGKKGDQFAKQLQSGDTMFSANGYYGAGTYWAWGSASASGEYGRYQTKGFLNAKARVITTNQLAAMGRTFSARHPKTYAALVSARAGYGGTNETLYSFLAASHGYNVIQRDSHKTAGTYMVTLDRSVLTMSTKMIKNANGSTVNW